MNKTTKIIIGATWIVVYTLLLSTWMTYLKPDITFIQQVITYLITFIGVSIYYGIMPTKK